MRKHIKVGILSGLFGIVLLASVAHAVPSLQLDIGGGVYDWSTQTIVATSDSFTLYALLSPNWANTTGDTYYISAALTPITTPPGANLGSFQVNSTPVNVTGDMTYGVPPIELNGTAYNDPGDLPIHGMYPTYFKEFSFTFNPLLKAQSYDTQTQTGQFVQVPSGTTSNFLYYVPFSIDTSRLNSGYAIHFDLYNEYLRCNQDIDISWFAPFSHDAQSGGTPVPEPSTYILLGSGLIGMASYGRKRFRK